MTRPSGVRDRGAFARGGRGDASRRPGGRGDASRSPRGGRGGAAAASRIFRGTPPRTADRRSAPRRFQLHFGVRPCRYPARDAWALAPADAVPDRTDARDVYCFSVDNASTRDVDDARSGAGTVPSRCLLRAARVPERLVEVSAELRSVTAQALSLSEPDADGARTLGIHIADVASRVPETSPLYAWALARGSSAYVYRVEISA